MNRRRHARPARTRQHRAFCAESLDERLTFAADLIAQWKAEDLAPSHQNQQTVTQWTDQVGGRIAKGQGQPAFREGIVGGRAAIEFQANDGTDQLLVDRLSSPMVGIGDFSLVVYFSTQGIAPIGAQGDWFRNTALVDGNSLGFAYDWGISINAQGQIAAGLGFGLAHSPITLYSSNGGYHDAGWHTAIFSRQGSTISLAVDGTDIVQRADAHANPLASVDLAIGAHKLGAMPFSGQVAEVRVYRGMLLPEESSNVVKDLRSYYQNAAPTSNADHYSLLEDASFFFVPASQGVLANDTDPERDPLTAELVTPPARGRLVLNPDGSFFYTPAKDSFGTESFTYAARDFRAGELTTVTLTITATYDPPVPAPDTYSLRPTDTLTLDAQQGVLANDANPDRANLQVELIEPPAWGEFTLRPDGSMQFSPQGRAGTTTARYRLLDSVQPTSAATITLIINTPPIANPDQYFLPEDTPLVLAPAQGILKNDLEADGDPLQIEWMTLPEHGTVTLAADNQIIYTPTANYHGVDRWTYRLFDGIEYSSIADVNLEIHPVNDRPSATDDLFSVLADRPLEITAARGVLINDTDIDRDALSARIVQLPAHGSLSLSSDGSFRYEPILGYRGPDQFTYDVWDGQTASAIAKVNLQVQATPLMITEFMASNGTTLATRLRATATDTFAGDPMTTDWIEIYNPSSSPIPLDGLHLTDDQDNLTQWAFPAGYQLGGQSYLVVYASGRHVTDPALDEQGRFHTNFSLNSDGGYLALTFADGTIISEVIGEYPAQRTNISYGLTEQGWRYQDPSNPSSAQQSGIATMLDPVSFAPERGFYDQPIEVELVSPYPGATLIYTTNNSLPSLTNGTPIRPAIASESATIRLLVDKTTTLRAIAVLDGHLASDVQTHTYLFVADVAKQSSLSTSVRNHATWGPLLDDALLALPTISLTTAGTISEAREIGTSVEYMDPSGAKGFQIDAGVEHYGGHSLNSPKKNMRLSFKSQYGAGSLRHDIFGPQAVNEFEELLLRTGSHDTFFWTHPGGGRGNYLRNRWIFDRQLEMGQPAPHGKFVHVYINGRYWGMHELMERPNADFMASYLGGTADQYDAINAGSAIDGNLTAWRSMQQNAVIDDYTKLKKLLDVDNYADYMLLQFFGGNDWDWGTEQNWMAAGRRDGDGEEGFHFFAWDSDVILRTTAEANVVGLGGPSNLWNVNGGVKQHPEFRMLMADRAQEYFLDGGMLTDERLRADIEAMASTIRLPIIAESARWGGNDYLPSTWESAVQWMLNRFAPVGPASRAITVIGQLRRAKIFPSIDAPTLLVDGQAAWGDVIVPNAGSVRFGTPVGEVYYTRDGSDPRLPGGGLNPLAVVAPEGAIPLDATNRLFARVLYQGEWSTPRQATLYVDAATAAPESLRLTEIQYHPRDPDARERAAGFEDGDEFEFLELRNVSSRIIDLRAVQLVTSQVNGSEQGVTFDFSTSAIRFLLPGARLVVVENSAAFALRYGSEVQIAGEWVGALDNRGERLELRFGEQSSLEVNYSDRWYPETDGDGPSLQLLDEVAFSVAEWSTSTAWRPSRTPDGSPNRPDQALPGDANRDGIFDSRDLVQVFAAGEYEDGQPANSSWEDGDWDGDGEFTTADLVAAFETGAYSAASTIALDAVWAAWDSRRDRQRHTVVTN